MIENLIKFGENCYTERIAEVFLDKVISRLVKMIRFAGYNASVVHDRNRRIVQYLTFFFIQPIA